MYPGFLQLTGFLTMNLGSHMESHFAMFKDLVKGDAIFAATGVTSGSLLEGVKRRKDCMTTESVVMRASSGTVRWVKGEHRLDKNKG